MAAMTASLPELEEAVFNRRPTFAQNKRGFKEKLLDTLAVADAVAGGAGAGAGPSRQQLLVDALVEGNVAAFVSLFYLTAADRRPSDEELLAEGLGARSPPLPGRRARTRARPLSFWCCSSSNTARVGARTVWRAPARA